VPLSFVVRVSWTMMISFPFLGFGGLDKKKEFFEKEEIFNLKTLNTLK